MNVFLLFNPIINAVPFDVKFHNFHLIFVIFKFLIR